MMYQQILTRPQDRQHQHIFYRPPFEQSPVLEYELNTVTYGVTLSAFHSQRSLIQFVKDHGLDFSVTANVLVRDPAGRLLRSSSI